MPNTSPKHSRRFVPQPGIDARIAALLAAINSNSRQSLLDFLRIHMDLPASGPMTIGAYAN
jgi:hypothetical protein